MLLPLLVSLFAAAQTLPPDAFWASLQALCGKAFAGRVTEAVPADTVFSRATLVMHVRECSSHTVRVPFHVGSDRSRTWVITRTAETPKGTHDGARQNM